MVCKVLEYTLPAIPVEVVRQPPLSPLPTPQRFLLTEARNLGLVVASIVSGRCLFRQAGIADSVWGNPALGKKGEWVVLTRSCVVAGQRKPHAHRHNDS